MLQRDRLIMLRKSRKLRQQDVANALNITRGAYMRYENGRNQPPNDILVAIAFFFEVTTDFLLGVSIEPSENLKELHSRLCLIGFGDTVNGLSRTEIEAIIKHVELNKEFIQAYLEKQ